MGAESWSVSGTAKVADDEILRWEAQVKVGLEVRVVEHAFAQTVSNEDDAFAVGGRGKKGSRV